MPSRAFGMRRGSAGGPRAGASLRLLNQQRARQARPSTSDGVSKRRPQLSALELELEKDAAEASVGEPGYWQRPPSRAREIHPDAQPAQSRDRARPSTAPEQLAVPAEPPTAAPAADAPAQPSAAPAPAPAPATGWSDSSRVRQRRHRQELLLAVEEGDADTVEALLRFGTPVLDTVSAQTVGLGR